MADSNGKITTSNILMTLFGAMFALIGTLIVMQLSDIKDAIKQMNAFMVDQKVENQKKDGEIERLQDKDNDLQKQLNDFKKAKHEE